MRPPTYNMYKSGYEIINVMHNLSDLLTIGGILLLCIPFVSVVRSLLPSVTTIDNMDRFIRGRFLIAMVNLTYLKIAFLSMLNFA